MEKLLPAVLPPDSARLSPLQTLKKDKHTLTGTLPEDRAGHELEESLCIEAGPVNRHCILENKERRINWKHYQQIPAGSQRQSNAKLQLWKRHKQSKNQKSDHHAPALLFQGYK